ncbi:unnamed protein product, partial [Mesorhabditis spiculigera]
MPFRKYRAITDFSKNNTRIFKRIYRNKLHENAPEFRVPEQVRAMGVTVWDPNDKQFPYVHYAKKYGIKEEITPDGAVTDPFAQASEDPNYKTDACYLFEGSEPLSDGLTQAASLAHAVLVEELPERVLKGVSGYNFDAQKVTDHILHAEKYDPTLEKLPRRFDPVIFWNPHPRVFGTPVVKRNNIMLDNFFRYVFLSAIEKGAKADRFKFDRDTYITATLRAARFHTQPMVLRFQPHIVAQSAAVPPPWAKDGDLTELMKLPVQSCAPVDPVIDLTREHVYNDGAHLARQDQPIRLNTLMWSREQDQKYPWTKEQNAANAVLHTFGAAVAQAKRGKDVEDLKEPVLVKGVQLVDGLMDLVAVQLNTLDIRPDNPTKNVVWIEKGVRLYRPKPFYEPMVEVEELNMDTFDKFAAVLLS